VCYSNYSSEGDLLLHQTKRLHRAADLANTESVVAAGPGLDFYCDVCGDVYARCVRDERRGGERGATSSKRRHDSCSLTLRANRSEEDVRLHRAKRHPEAVAALLSSAKTASALGPVNQWPANTTVGPSMTSSSGTSTMVAAAANAPDFICNVCASNYLTASDLAEHRQRRGHYLGMAPSMSGGGHIQQPGFVGSYADAFR